jgi:predicted kinase
VARSGDAELPALMPFYKCYRACVRGKIQALTWEDASVRGPAKENSLRLSRRYFALAHAYAQGRARPVVVVLHGLIGSGKSALGRWLWGRLGWPTLRSDALRKRLAGLTEATRVTEPFGQGLYSEAVTERVYGEMLAQARDRLAAGLAVVLDGSYGRQAHRQAVADLAAQAGARLVFIKTVCDFPEQRSRLERRPRTKNVSDGRVELMVKQAEAFDPPGQAEAGRLIILDTDGPKALTRAMAEAELKRHGLAD